MDNHMQLRWGQARVTFTGHIWLPVSDSCDSCGNTQKTVLAKQEAK